MVNFGAGPAKLPPSVVAEACSALMEWEDSGVGILEVSHRSPQFSALIKRMEDGLRELLGLSSPASIKDWAILSLTGGGTGQFSSVPLNLLKNSTPKNSHIVLDYLITGIWSTKAAKEAERLTAAIPNVQIRRISCLNENGSLKRPEDIETSAEALYCYYCDNETVEGREFPEHYFENLNRSPKTLLVGDHSSNFLSRPINFDIHSLVFAGAQKNFGPAGLTIVCLRRSVFVSAEATVTTLPTPTTFPPAVLDYEMMDRSKSLLNTPPVFSIYVCERVCHFLLKNYKTLAEMDGRSKLKSGMIYCVLEKNESFYEICSSPTLRSRMNVTFRIRGGDVDLEAKFLEQASGQGFLQLKGHRDVGGIRISLYNAIDVDEVERIQSFIAEFADRNL